jgi:purine-binding chemotaxis protein CheW
MDGIANLEDRIIMMLNLENILVDKEWKSLEQMDEPETLRKKAAPKPKK